MQGRKKNPAGRRDQSVKTNRYGKCKVPGYAGGNCEWNGAPQLGNGKKRKKSNPEINTKISHSSS